MSTIESVMKMKGTVLKEKIQRKYKEFEYNKINVKNICTELEGNIYEDMLLILRLSDGNIICWHLYNENDCFKYTLFTLLSAKDTSFFDIFEIDNGEQQGEINSIIINEKESDSDDDEEEEDEDEEDNYRVEIGNANFDKNGLDLPDRARAYVTADKIRECAVYEIK